MSTTQTRIEISAAFKVPVLLPASFVLNGASSPTDAQVGGDVESVTRLLTTVGARPFFRVRFRRRFPTLTIKNSAIAHSVDAAENSAVLLNVSRAGFVAATAIDLNREVDVQVMVGGVAVDTAGIQVGLQLLYDAGKR